VPHVLLAGSQFIPVVLANMLHLCFVGWCSVSVCYSFHHMLQMRQVGLACWGEENLVMVSIVLADAFII